MCRFIFCMVGLAATAALGQTNYDESKVPDYTLPDPLETTDGQAITSADQWPARRREVHRMFEEQMFGRAPGKPNEVSIQMHDKKSDAFGGLATRRQLAISLGDKAPTLELLIFTPNEVEGPAPAFLGLNFGGNQSTIADPEIRMSDRWMRKKPGVVDNKATEATRGVGASRWPYQQILKRGYAVVTLYYGDIDPDFHDEFKNGVHAMYPGEHKPSDWGSIAAWAWGLSRVMDYLETDDAIDHKRIAVLGHSRLGKTALWAGANDPRFALVISNNSGCGGAALSRRKYGETVNRINTSFPHWFCDNFKQYNDQEAKLPFDQHMLIALIAPRPVIVSSAVEDRWADPKGEFLSVKHASPVFELLGEEGLGADTMPAAGEPVLTRAAYNIRTGKHNVTPGDWNVFCDFADRHMK